MKIEHFLLLLSILVTLVVGLLGPILGVVVQTAINLYLLGRP